MKLTNKVKRDEGASTHNEPNSLLTDRLLLCVTQRFYRPPTTLHNIDNPTLPRHLQIL
jgi:hypothetical protein